MLASTESVISIHSAPRIRLPASLGRVTLLSQPESSFLIGNYPLALCNLGAMNRNENIVDSCRLSATSKHDRDLFK